MKTPTFTRIVVGRMGQYGGGLFGLTTTGQVYYWDEQAENWIQLKNRDDV